MDSSAIDVFRRIEQQARQDGVRLVLCAMPKPLRDTLSRHGVMAEGRLAGVASADRAIENAEEAILAGHGQAAEAMPTSFVRFLSEFGDVADAERRLAPFLTRVAHAPGEVIMRQGEAATDMVFLEGGRAIATLQVADSQPGTSQVGTSQDQGHGPVHLRTMQAGSLLGEVALLRGGERTASVIAETACVGQRLTRVSLARMETEDPALALVLQRAILIQLADRLADNTRAVELALR
jgi:SulP family sulfate permease